MTMRKDIAIQILSTLAAGRELSPERVTGETFAALLDQRMVALDHHEPAIMPAGRAYLDAERARAEKAKRRSRANSRARGQAMRDLGLRRVPGGWE